MPETVLVVAITGSPGYGKVDPGLRVLLHQDETVIDEADDGIDKKCQRDGHQRDISKDVTCMPQFHQILKSIYDL